MKHAVGDHLEAEIARRRPVDGREEMVPLQDLVQQDAVEEAAEREADHGIAGDGPAIGRRAHATNASTMSSATIPSMP